ncbi:hypothetical protein QN277_000786 [Acacia crassicarpa]|uniref:Endonuclease/exonuclease/phosphatase domain-containing protein n=1 Tax=Acacia crassicarpa TaxID=499986 RepID=A0AAE1N743_9FABA|nr:hypothetical protein QN277_000786 [Acacia crassicarpa]
MIVLSETKCANAARFRCFQSMGFDRQAFMPSVGRSGGMVAVWRSNMIDVAVCNLDRQFIHFKCSCRGWPLFFLTSIYSIPICAQKLLLWNALEDFASSLSIPWVVFGDFNDIVSASEKSGGCANNDSRFRRFTDRLRRCKLSDLGFCGSKFTWRGPLFRGRRIFERLDRALVNDAFLSSFGNCVLKVLPRTKFSDHNPICLNWESETQRSMDRPFRFEAMWIKHAQYKSFLEGEWVAEGNINESLGKLRNSLGVWNRNVFGLVECQKYVIMKRLEGIQCSQAYPRSQFLCSLEAKLHEDLERLLDIEEIKWFQKSRSDWISMGDQNTRFYHLKAKVRRHRNKVSMLKNQRGVWVDDVE